MHYAMFIHLDHERFTALPAEEQNRIHRACGAWHDDLVARQRSVGAHGLQPPAAGAALRVVAGRTIITDGPFTESKELLGGLELLDCADLAEAKAIAARFPGLEHGYCALELRPLVTGGTCEA